MHFGVEGSAGVVGPEPEDGIGGEWVERHETVDVEAEFGGELEEFAAARVGGVCFIGR